MRIMQPVRFPPGEVPNVTNLPAAEGQSFRKGVILTRIGDTVQPHPGGTTTDGIFGVSQCGATDGKGDALNGLVNIAKADKVTEFGALLYDGTAEEEVAYDRELHLGGRYGFIRVDGQDYIDVDDTSNAVVEIVDGKDLGSHTFVIFKFLDSARQET